MSWYDDYKRKVALAKARIENKTFAAKNGNAKESKIVPATFVGLGSDKVIEKPIIGSHTGKIIAYDTNYGTVHAGCDYHDHRTGTSILSPATEEYEAMQELSYPHCP